MKHALILSSEQGLPIAQSLAQELSHCDIISKKELAGTVHCSSLSAWVQENFTQYQSLIFLGATGIALRCIAPCVRDKHQDPAVICIDMGSRYVIPLLSGHVGGANALSKRLAGILGAQAIITTQSDSKGLWALDTLAQEYGWQSSLASTTLNEAIAHFVKGKPTALLLDIRDKGSDYLERSAPAHVDVFTRFEDIPQGQYALLIAVSPFLYPSFSGRILYYHPRVLHLGMGCRKNCPSEGIAEDIVQNLKQRGIAPEALASLSSIELKKDEKLLHGLLQDLGIPHFQTYSAEQLAPIDTPNQSAQVEAVTGSPSVAEAAAILSAEGGALICEKQKGKRQEGGDFTFAVAQQAHSPRRGHIEIVGAGPGDPELVSVRGKHFLERADLILYAGSLVPIELTYYAKEGATVRSSASLHLEEQFALMKKFYDRGKLVVRLHTGDPCIYGAIQEQMAYFDQYDMSYHITPGISSFLAAAAALRSQFTIPEKVQSIILTRGEGRTPMPDKEKLHLLAKSQSTMCIFLSASIVDQVQKDLLEHYPPHTPVAACYKLTWKDERIYRGELRNLAQILKENHLTLTTMIVVGEAIDNRRGLSKLYDAEFKHIFRG